jgi:hypothetical protein
MVLEDFVPNVAVEWLVLHITEVQVRYIDPDACSPEDLCDFSQSPEANTRIVPQIRP